MSDTSHLPDATTKAILFDCDGTLVDTMPIHREVWHQLFLRYDFIITDDWWEEWANLPLLPMVLHVIPDATPELADQLNLEAMDMYNDMLHMIEP
ncbi:MAG: Haloacid dehalogenase-like hydrolase, partial [Actinomycetota bacterium]